jgi:hypothetical protein
MSERCSSWELSQATLLHWQAHKGKHAVLLAQLEAQAVT